MTQRRRLDAYLAEQAAEAGADFRDGVRVTALEADDDGVTVASTAPRHPHGRDRRRRRQRAHRAVVGRDRRTVAMASRSRATCRHGVTRASDYRGRAVARARHRPRRLRLGLPEGRPRQRRRRRLGAEGPRLREHLARALPRATGSPVDRLETVRGYRLPLRRARRARRARPRAARRRRRRARRPALGRRDLRGVRSARGSRRRASRLLAGESLEGYEPALDGRSRPRPAGVLGRQGRARPLPAPDYALVRLPLVWGGRRA